MKIVIIGHGRMGRLVEQYATAHGFAIAGIVTEETGPALFESGDIPDVR